MFKLKLAVLSIIIMLFAGCASAPKPAAYDNSHSKAWNIATAAGLKNVKDYVVTDHTDLNAALLAGTYIGASQIPGVSFSATNIGVGMLSSVLTSGIKPAEAVPHIFVWMPAKMANTPIEARAKAVKHIATAIKKTIPEFANIALINHDEHGDDYDNICITPCMYSVKTYHPLFGEDYKEPGKKYDPLSVYANNQPSTGYSPEIIGSYKSWNFDLTNGFNDLKLTLPTNIKNPLHDKSPSFELSVSKKLPPYFYFYLPATTKHGPLIINRGKILTFAKPKVVAHK